jgi:hypothetical protein
MGPSNSAKNIDLRQRSTFSYICMYDECLECPLWVPSNRFAAVAQCPLLTQSLPNFGTAANDVQGQNETSGPGNCHSYARVHRGCCTRQAVSTELVTTLAGVRDRFNFDQSRRLGTSSRWDDGNVVAGSDAPTVLFLCQDQLQTRAVNTVASARMPGGNLV